MSGAMRCGNFDTSTALGFVFTHACNIGITTDCVDSMAGQDGTAQLVVP
jgi:hypothetical protein